MSRVIHDVEGVRSVSSFVDPDGVQALITLRAAEGFIRAEVRFRRGPSGEFSEPIVLGDDFPS